MEGVLTRFPDRITAFHPLPPLPFIHIYLLSRYLDQLAPACIRVNLSFGDEWETV